MSITIMRTELMHETRALVGEVLDFAARPEGTELARARKLKALEPLLERVALYANAVRETLEAEQQADDDALCVRALLTEGASELLALFEELPDEHPDVPALAALCVCGRERGDHLAIAPHGSDDDGGPVCLGFAPADRATERPICSVPTEPPPPAPSERELEAWGELGALLAGAP